MADILQFGASGQLGRALLREAERGRKASGQKTPAPSIAALDRRSADLLDPDACAAQVAAVRPKLVILAAAYTAVDQAESEPDLAMRVNAETPAAIAHAAARLGAPLIYISTDYVFDGRGGAPYSERVEPAPINAYGRSKAAGEAAVLAEQPASLVLRTSWVFDAVGRNFLTTMLRLGAERDALRVVDDQRGAPTAAGDLAHAALLAANALLRELDADDLRGIFHYQGAPSASWADFADAIFEAAQPFWGRRPELERIPSSEYPTPAPRPLDTRLDCRRFLTRFEVEQPDWRAAVAAAVTEALGASGAKRP